MSEKTQFFDDLTNAISYFVVPSAGQIYMIINKPCYYFTSMSHKSGYLTKFILYFILNFLRVVIEHKINYMNIKNKLFEVTLL